MNAHVVFLWLFVAFEAVGALLTIAMIGKPRAPLGAGAAIATVVFAALWITVAFIYFQ